MKDTRRRALNLGELLIAGEILSVEIIFRFLNLVGSDRIGRILCYESHDVTERIIPFFSNPTAVAASVW
jgi:hypothetical protein